MRQSVSSHRHIFMTQKTNASLWTIDIRTHVRQIYSLVVSVVWGAAGGGGDDDHLLALRERSPYIIFDERQFCQPRLLLTTLQKLRARLLSVTLGKHAILQHNNARPHTSRKTFYRLKFDDTRRTAPIWHPVASSFFPS